jgi:hypothetical protein
MCPSRAGAPHISSFKRLRKIAASIRVPNFIDQPTHALKYVIPSETIVSGPHRIMLALLPLVPLGAK